MNIWNIIYLNCGKIYEKISILHALFFFGSHPIFRAGKTLKISFLGLSLPLNPTKTLATQAREDRHKMFYRPITSQETRHILFYRKIHCLTSEFHVKFHDSCDIGFSREI